MMDTEIITLLWSGGVIAFCTVSAIVLRVVLVKGLSRWAARTKSPVDGKMAGILGRHLVFWGVLAGLFMAAQILAVSPEAGRWVNKAVLLSFLLSATLAAASISSHFVMALMSRGPSPTPISSLGGNLTRIVIFAFGGLLILSNMGIAIGPLLTALGVGSLAVGLALQETLSNFFAGFYLLVSRQVRIGDYIEVESGIGYGKHEGFVVDIGWRASRLKARGGDYVLVPNSIVTQAIITGYAHRGRVLSVPLEIPGPLKDNLPEAERLALLAARATLGERGAAGAFPQAFVRFGTQPGGAPTMTLFIPSEGNQPDLLTHDLMKKISSWLAVKEPAAPESRGQEGMRRTA